VAEASNIGRLRTISLFEDLTDAELTRVGSYCVTRTYGKGTQILTEEDESTDVLFILEGTARISSTTPSGKEVIFSELGAGDITGEFAAVDGLPRSASVSALTDCLAARMSSANFIKMMNTTPLVATKLVELLVVKIRRLSERVFEVSALSVRERVRRELLRLATEGTRLGQGVVIRPAPTHYEIAARIGSHREAVTREFNRLEENRIVEIRRRQIRIVNLDLLRSDDLT
jgi:CRP/FNR family transcriptional regulator, cyclic AMP receptor protein